MSNPIQAAILHDRRLDSIREDKPDNGDEAAILVWKHCSQAIPPERKVVVITNDQSIIVGMKTDENTWKCGTNTFTFEQFPKWAEHPNFAKSVKKTALVAKNMGKTPTTP